MSLYEGRGRGRRVNVLLLYGNTVEERKVGGRQGVRPLASRAD